MDDENNEEMLVGANVSVSTVGLFETILNLKKWILQPWSLKSVE